MNWVTMFRIFKLEKLYRVSSADLLVVSYARRLIFIAIL
jgi:hypothetical protein